MKNVRSSSSLRRIAVVAVLAAIGIMWRPALAQQDANRRTVYVSALDKQSQPVTDMQPADFELKDGGKVQAITVKPATEPMRISILVADWGTGSFQAGMQRFMEPLLGKAEFSITSLLPQPIVVMNYAHDPRTLSDGLSKVGQRGRQDGAQVLEGIMETSKTVRGNSKRPVVLVLRIGNEFVSTLPGDTVREAIRKSGAKLYVLNLGVRTAATQSIETGGLEGHQARLHDMEQKDAAFALAQVLGDGSRESGGRNEQVISTTLVNVMEGFAQELLHQYEITYTSTAGKPGEKISVTSKRNGVTVRAPNQARF